ncbi:hypothetical protein ACH4U6_35315 [Streptomyces netropsis]|uniref:hypothetical protein n=1 Tax=Streptomyces netropsis TaxID=55404 RepID=UPI0037AC6F3A
MASAALSQSERVERLRAQLRGRPVSRRAQKIASAPRDSRLLYGVLLRAAARLDQGLELTDLEASLLAPLAHMLSQEEIRELGRVYAEEGTARQTTEMFPQVLAGRKLDEGYSLADLLEDLPTMASVSTQPNVHVVDIASNAEALDSEEFSQILNDAGYGVTVLTSSEQTDQAVPVTFQARVDMEKSTARTTRTSPTGTRSAGR